MSSIRYVDEISTFPTLTDEDIAVSTARLKRMVAEGRAEMLSTPAAPAKRLPREPLDVKAVGGFVQSSPRFVRG